MIWDFGDYAIGGWTIELIGPVSATTVTDARGNYTFSSLPGGTYRVCAVPQAGWVQTVPWQGVTCPSGALGYQRIIPDGSALNYLGHDFGSVPPAQPEEPAPPQ